MTPFEYLARNYVRNYSPDRFQMDEWWEDDVQTYRAYLAGAERMLQELKALETPDLEDMEELLFLRLSNESTYFTAWPANPEDLFGGALGVRFGDGRDEALAEVPCPDEYQRKIHAITFSSEIPTMYAMAFRMAQEFHARSPETVMQLAPLLVEYLLAHHDPRDGVCISFAEVLEFCDSMIAQGRVTLEYIPFPFIQSDAEEDNLERLEADAGSAEDDNQETYEPMDPEDDIPF